MATFVSLLLIVHIAGGFAALISGFIASVTRKGAKAHRSSGKVYFWGMTLVFVTAVSLGILKEKWFLFMVGFFSYYMVVRGYRILYLKKLGAGQRAARLDWAVALTGLLFGGALVASSLWGGMKGFSPVPFVFGIICIGFARKDIQLFLKGPKHRQHWLFGHIAGMGGGYIATWTAFLVTNVTFLPPVLVWLAPAIIGSTLITFTIRRYRLRGKLVKAGAVAALLLVVSGVQAQEPDSTYSMDYLKKSTSFAWLTYGIDVHGVPGGKTVGTHPQQFGTSAEPRFVISGMHFWGHADFYVAIALPLMLGKPEVAGAPVRINHRVETGARVYPWKVKLNSVRPYAGISFRSFSYNQEAADPEPHRYRSSDYDQVVFPLQAGLTYTSRKYHITAGVHHLRNNRFDYYTGPATRQAVQLKPFTFNAGIVRYIDTDRHMRTARGVQVENILYERLKRYRKFNVAYAGVGPSAALPVGRSAYLAQEAPALHQSLPFNIMPDLTIGYHFARPDVNVGFSYRPMTSRLRGYADELRQARHSFMLEGYKYLFNWLGFAPYLGPTVSAERLSASHNGERTAAWKPAIGFIAGWDIRVTKTGTSVLRTNLRWTPGLHLDVKGSELRYDPLEFNFIQYVVFLGRKKFYRQQFGGA